MYLQKVIIHNIRSITDLEMEFPNPAGWHVLIGDNGSGKSSVIRAIAATLIGPQQIMAILPVWSEWLRQNEKKGFIELKILQDKRFDQSKSKRKSPATISNKFILQRENGRVQFESNFNDTIQSPHHYNWGNTNGWFSVAYGAFRRFTGGDDQWNKVFSAAPKAGAHLSVFGEDIALTEALDWIKELDHRRLKDIEESDMLGLQSNETRLFKCLKKCINDMSLLPNGVQFEKVDRNGALIFKDGYGITVNIKDMSDGFRSILSLTLELIRQLILTYSVETVFPKGVETEPVIQIKLPGVVLIDEIDVHLHPTWQTKIGKWFTQVFPNIQFIVATHSPLICRACGHTGTVWRLANRHENLAAEIKGIERAQLIHGNILDAYGTEIFGDDVSIDEETAADRNRLGELYEKSIMGLIEPSEKAEFNRLKTVYPNFNVEIAVK